MAIYDEIGQAWAEFRAVAGVTVTIDGSSVEAVAVGSITTGMTHGFDSSGLEAGTRVAIRDTDWTAKGMGLEKAVAYQGKTWRVSGFEKHPVSPIVFVDLVEEG